ncbi:MAG TPA: hypothetical protein VN682_16150 [Terriglobales bacterium]|nr:hypothetical protein [Terriglobales bacterium]
MVVGQPQSSVVGLRPSAKPNPGEHGFSRADHFLLMSFRAALATRNLEFSAGESGDDGIRDALPLSYTAEAMAGVEPATFGLEVTVVFTTGELQIPRSTRQFAKANVWLRSG